MTMAEKVREEYLKEQEEEFIKIIRSSREWFFYAMIMTAVILSFF